MGKKEIRKDKKTGIVHLFVLIFSLKNKIKKTLFLKTRTPIIVRDVQLTRQSSETKFRDFRPLLPRT